ncbi:MAG TPA: fibronectin type III domain-containing protein, partial [Mycobacteriales bacterium]|nr:fibronectin type III domain-containing protein [Mycobacteriales bacterium]
TTSDADAVVDVALTDAVPGVANGSVTLVNTADSNDEKVLTFDATDLESGTLTNGVFQATAPSAWTWIDAGTWTVAEVDATDGYGNVTADTSVAGPPTLTVTATSDAVAPVVATPAPAFSPTSVAVTGTAETTTLSAHITDAVSGFVAGVGDLTDGSDAIPVSITAADRVSGTANDGTYDVAVSVPARQPAGTYKFSDLTLVDRAGNSGTGAKLADLPSLTVTDAADSTGPTLASLAVGPAKVNADGADATVSIVAHATDDVSGVSEIDLTLTDANSSTTTVSLTSANRVSGSALSGTYATTIPAVDFALGAVIVTSVVVNDVAGNATSYSTSQLSAAQLSTGFTVVDQSGDTIAPTLSSVTLSPTSVSTASGPASVTVTAQAGDTGPSGVAASGVSTVTVAITPPGAGSPVLVTLGASQLTGGNADNATFSAVTTIPRFAVNGSWSITDVTVSDTAGNVSDYSGAQLSAAGAAKSVTVSGPVDSTAPTLVTLTGPSSLDPATGAGTASYTFGWSDGAGSGLCLAQLVLTSPSGTRARQASYDSGSKCETSGQTTLSVTFPTFTESGSWTLALTMTDGEGNQRVLSSADLAAAGASHTLAVTGATDTQPPTVAGLSFDPSTADVTGTSADVVVAAELTDTGSNSGSGVASASAVVTEPDGSTTVPVALTLVAGNSQDGFYEGGFTIPAYGQTGSWFVSSLQVSDNVGNAAAYDPSQLNGGGLTDSMTATGTSDTTPPAVAGITFTPTQTSITGADGTSTAALHLTDDSSGVVGASFDLIGPDDTDLPEQTGASPDSGTPQDGVWDVAIDVPAWSSTGAWRIDNLLVVDGAGNVASYASADLLTAGLTDTLTVTGTTDTAPPTLTGLAFSPTSVTVSTGGGTASVTATVTDDASGFAGGTITVAGTTGKPVTGQFATAPHSGTAKNGTFQAALDLPPFAAAGAWTVTGLSLFDNAGHEQDYTRATLPGSAATGFTVTDDTADTTPPKLVGLTLSRANVDVGVGQSDELMTLHVTDNRSGLADGSVILTAPSGLVSAFPLASYQPGGSAVDGVYQVDAAFTSASELGTWTVSQVDLSDQSGNTATIHASTLPDPHSFTVSTTANLPTAPTALSVTPSGLSATLAWKAPSDDGGVPLTGYTVTVTPTPRGFHRLVVSATTPTATITGLLSGKTYAFSVAAENNKGRGKASKSVSLAGTRVTMTASKRSVKARTKVKLSGVLTDATKKRRPIAKQRVSLLAEPAGSHTFDVVGHAVTSKRGTVTLTVRPRKTSRYEWSYAGTRNARAGAESVAVAVTVKAPH